MIEFTGPAEAPVILLLPGLAATPGFFADLVNDLSHDHRVATIALPGHGVTDHGVTDHGVTGQDVTGWAAAGDVLTGAVDRIGRIVDELDLHGITLLGWSLGANVAYGYLDRFGTGRVAALISVEQTPRLVSDGGWPHAAFGGLDIAGAEQLLGTVTADYATFAGNLVGASFAANATPDPDVVAGLIAEAMRCDPAAVALLLSEAVAADWRAWMPQVHVPTLLIHGARSQVYPTPVGPWLRDAIPGAELVVFDDSGHLPFIEEPARFTATVRAFVARVATGAVQAAPVPHPVPQEAR